MTFLAPAYLYASLVAAGAVIALHFIVTRRPRAVAFPTARFVPDAPVEATARAVQFSDPIPLILRVLTLLAIGAALASPIPAPQRERIARVIVADMSSSAERAQEVRDSVRSLWRAGDALVAFDTLARPVTSPDSLHPGAAAPGVLSAALVAALRAAPRVRSGADSIELVIVSPISRDETDGATHSIRALWPGRARLVRVAESHRAPVIATVEWNASRRPTFAVARSHVDTVGAVIAGGTAVVAPFVRRWLYPHDSLAGARVVARWVDGEPAAIERGDSSGCVRSIAILIDSTGDLPLRPSVTRLGGLMRAPCAAITRNAAAVPIDSRSLAGTGSLAAASMFPPEIGVVSPYTPWLLAASLAFMLLEITSRRIRRQREDRR